MKKLIALAVFAAAASGCATTNKYACPHPNGVTCMSATDIYKATNNADEVVGVDPKKARELAREGKPAGKVVSPSPAAEATEQAPATTTLDPAPARAASSVVIEGDTLALADTPPAVTQPLAPAVNSTEPYRVPAKIMRIFIRPWEDEKNNLHMGGFVFTEIEPRRWSVAPSALHVDDRAFELLDAPKMDAAAVDANKGNGAATPPRPPQGGVAPPTQKGTSQ